MIIDDASIIKEVVAWIGAGVAGVIAWAVKSTSARLNKLEKCAVKRPEFAELEKSAVRRDEFREYSERAECARDELREGITKLFDKVDELKTLLIQHGKS